MSDIVKVYTIDSYSHVFIEKTRGCIDDPLRARTQDFFFCGSGYTPAECLVGVIDGLRRAADKLEELL